MPVVAWVSTLYGLISAWQAIAASASITRST
jgi:hypothetical protein